MPPRGGRQSNIKSYGVFSANNGAGQSIRLDSSDLKYLANEIDTFESTAKGAVASAIDDAGGDGNPDGSWTDLCTAIRGLPQDAADSVIHDLLNANGHIASVSGLPFREFLSVSDSDHSVRTSIDTWRKEFYLRKDENGSAALLGLINLNIYAARHMLYEGRCDSMQATYTFKTDTGTVLKTGTVQWGLNADYAAGYDGDYSTLVCTPVTLCLLGARTGNAQKVIVEVSWNLSAHTNPGHDTSRTQLTVIVDKCDAYYVNM